MLVRIWALAKKEFLHLRHDWWLPAFMLIGGSMELLLVGWATSRPITNLPLRVLDHDRSPASRRLIMALENTGTFELDGFASNMASLRDSLDRGEINAAVIIPPDYAKQLASSIGRPTVAVILNGAESIPASEALRAVEGVVTHLGQRVALQRLRREPERFAGFDPSLRVWFNESLSKALYTTPAELGLMLEFTVLLFAALAFSRERELGTLEQLLVMPFSSAELIIGKAIPALVVGFTDFWIMLAMVHAVFDVPLRGSLLLLFVLAFLYVLVELSKGLVLSVISRTQHQAFLLVMLVGMADFMFTGYAVPVEGMPRALQFLANFVPAHHWLTILRGILLKSAGLDVLWSHVLALLLLGAVVMTFSWRFVRRALD